MNETIGLLAGAFEAAAIWLLGSKRRAGFICGLVCNVLWVVFVVKTQGTYGLLLVCPVAAILNMRGWVAWRLPRVNSSRGG